MRKRRLCAFLEFLFACLLCCSIPQTNALAQGPQHGSWQPQQHGLIGVYAHLDVEDAINQYTGPANPTSEQLHAYLRNLYVRMFANPALVGIELGEHWKTIQTRTEGPSGTPVDQFDWSYLDDAFLFAHVAHKSLRLNITPGIYSPAGVLGEIPPCDGLFPGTPGPVMDDCGTVQFQGVPEKGPNEVFVFPLPWNCLYKNAWADFLSNLNARYKDREEFASIVVAGPIGASPEMILPTDNNDSSPQPSGEPVDAMWRALIKNAYKSDSSYWGTDQVFIDQWEQTIDTYEKIFSGISLDLTPDTGDDFPEFSSTLPPILPPLYTPDCNATPFVMSCEAKVEIISYFISEQGHNGKSTKVGGMTASSNTGDGNIGIPGVKLLTSLDPQPWPPIRGGADFDYPVSDPTKILQEGCIDYPDVSNCQNITPEEAAYNVLTDFFYGTPAGPEYGSMRGPAPVQYLKIDYTDVLYAEENPCPPQPSKSLGRTSLQDLLFSASRSLFKIAYPRLEFPSPPSTCRWWF